MRTAWYVDDDQEMLRAISLMMSLIDFQVQPFLDVPTAARELLAGKKPDVLILDINMPQVSGIDMLEFIRMKNEFNTLPVVMLSTENADVQVDKLLEMGADAFAIKPVTLDELEKAIQDALLKRCPQHTYPS